MNPPFLCCKKSDAALPDGDTDAPPPLQGFRSAVCLLPLCRPLPLGKRICLFSRKDQLSVIAGGRLQPPHQPQPPTPVSRAERPHHFNSAAAQELPAGGGISLKETQSRLTLAGSSGSLAFFSPPRVALNCVLREKLLRLSPAKGWNDH